MLIFFFVLFFLLLFLLFFFVVILFLILFFVFLLLFLCDWNVSDVVGGDASQRVHIRQRNDGCGHPRNVTVGRGCGVCARGRPAL